MTGRRISLRILATGIALAAVAWLIVMPRFRPHVFSGAVIQSGTRAPAVDLLSSSGGRVRLSDFEGDLVVLYFGYSFCPDVCPATLSTLDRALDRLGDEADDVQVIMITVDPLRDTPEVLAEYLGYFDPRFLGMTGAESEIAGVATVYGVYFQAREGSVDTGYLVDHTASIMVIDREGSLKLVLPPDVTVDEVVSDLDYLL